MKKSIQLLACVLMITLVNLVNIPTSFGQTPDEMSYQAVIRDASGHLIVSQSVSLQFSILQGSATGAAVYMETHSLSTNENGMVSLNIGNGNVVSGNFSTIDWSSGTYFIKSEIDPTGGNNYTISGTNQLLSVPYALHAKTAETFTGSINESDPIFTTSQAANITSGDIGNLANLSGTNTGDQDLSGLLSSEEDPVFTASPFGNLTQTEIDNWNSKLDEFIEADPIFAASIANGITAVDTAYWNSKLNEFVEADPTFLAHVSAGITQEDINKWNALWIWYTTNDKGYISEETDPVFEASIAKGITAADTAAWNQSGTPSLDQAYDKGGAGLGRTITADEGAFTVAGYDGIISTGTFGSADAENLPITGAGTRMIWHPKKAAFRAGYVNGSQWDTIGDYSVAFGKNTAAIDDYSVAFGEGARANGESSMAVGYYTTAGDNAFAAGYHSTATNEGSTAMGYNATASAGGATAMGENPTASGSYSTAFGRNTNASARASTAMGYYTTASGQYSTAMGYYTTAQAYGSVAIGRYNIGSGTTNSWVATEPVFEIGIGTDASNKANAMTVFKNGKVGIGITDEEVPARFTTYTSSGNDATALFASASTDGQQAIVSIMRTDENVNPVNLLHITQPIRRDPARLKSDIPAASPNLIQVDGPSGNEFIIKYDGKVGLGTDTPDTTLHIVGSLKMVDGNEGAGKVLTSDANGIARWATGSDAAKIDDLSDAKADATSVFLGSGAGTNDDGSTNNNVALGINALKSNTIGAFNTAFGTGVLENLDGGNRNTAIGYRAGNGTYGSGSVYLGYEAGSQDTSSNKLYIENSNSATPLIYGDFANDSLRVNGSLDVSGLIKIEGGSPALGKVLTSDANGLASWETATGASEIDDLSDAKTDATSVFLGSGAGANDDGTNNYNVAVGVNALKSNTTGGTNTANGSYALFSNTTGSFNTANGNSALNRNTTGSYNTANGSYALYSNTTGYSNTANGSNALVANTTGHSNTANGGDALYNNTTGSFNTANGDDALYSNTTGHSNTANGKSALASNTTGSFNTANGNSALNRNTTGSSNTANGNSALESNTTGSFNTALGLFAGASNETGFGNLFLGYQAGAGAGDISNKLYIDNSNTSTPLIYGDFANDSLRVNGGFVVANSSKQRTGQFLSTSTAGQSSVLEVVVGGNANPTNIVHIIDSSGDDPNLLKVDGPSANEFIITNAGKVGIGTNDPDEKLHIAGSLKMVDGNEGDGKVLTSDANGVASWETPSGGHAVGESYGGGIVFYVYDNGQHGLIAATSDQTSSVTWDNGTSRYTGASGDGLGAGEMNTAMIVATQIADNQTGSFAARICANYSATMDGITYGDWYLPSKYELNLLYLKKSLVGNFSSAYYWSSTETSDSAVWFQHFGVSDQDQGIKTNTVSVRAIRAF